MDYFEFGPFRLEVSSRALFRGGEFVPVAPTTLETLFLLVEEGGRVVGAEELRRRAWRDARVEGSSIEKNIEMLRRVLNPHFQGGGPIESVGQSGYRFTAPVRLRRRQADIDLVADSGPLDEISRQAIARRISSGGTDYDPSAAPHIVLGMAAAFVVISVAIAVMYYLR